MTEFVTYREAWQGYHDCKRHKRNAPEAIAYAQEYESNLHDLIDELNAGTYRISPAKRFAVALPRIREVYAYVFKDRIVEHILANRILPILELYFIPDSYSCRKGKGVLYGVQRMAEQISSIGKDCWYAELDISGYFPSMLREHIWEVIEPVIREGWNYGDDVDWWLQLLKMFIFHDPSKDCVECGDLEILKQVPVEKCLSHDRGEPIGNLLNQIFAIVYLTDTDKWLAEELEGYGRYVDDMGLLDTDHDKLLATIPVLRKKLAAIGLRLNEKKTIIQRADKGIKFTGYVIKPWGIYSGERLVRNALAASKTIEEPLHHLERLNSYLGFLRHTLSYSVRAKMWENTKKLYSGIYAKGHLWSIHRVKNKSLQLAIV